MTNILVIGSANMDLVVFAPWLPQPGETLLGDRFETIPGGKGANQAVAAARAAGRPGAVAFLGCVGSDPFGARLRDGLVADGVDVTHLRTVAGASGVAVIMSGGDNMIVVVPGANAALDAAAIAPSAFTGVKLVLAQLETPLDGVLAAAQATRAAGALFILDPAPARTLPRELLELVDWLTPNEGEACSLLGRAELGDPVEAALALKALGPRGVVLKRGGAGVVLCDGTAPQIIPAPAVTVADTTAAGDAFNGAFAVALSEGASPADAARFANAAAALSVTRPGAQPSMPRRNEIDALFHARLRHGGRA